MDNSQNDQPLDFGGLLQVNSDEHLNESIDPLGKANKDIAEAFTQIAKGNHHLQILSKYKRDGTSPKGLNPKLNITAYRMSTNLSREINAVLKQAGIDIQDKLIRHYENLIKEGKSKAKEVDTHTQRMLRGNERGLSEWEINSKEALDKATKEAQRLVTSRKRPKTPLVQHEGNDPQEGTSGTNATEVNEFNDPYQQTIQSKTPNTSEKRGAPPQKNPRCGEKENKENERREATETRTQA